MITVQSLHVYPIKSCRGIEIPSAEVVATGFRHDRKWMVVDPEGVFLSQRSHPSLARVTTRLETGRLLVGTAGLPNLEIDLDGEPSEHRKVRVWKDTCRATGEGSAAADWFSSLLGTPCELVRQPNDGMRQVDPRHAKPGDRVAFADGFPFLLISQASVDVLNRRLAEPVPTDRFRANIVVNGCEPHAEDRWAEIEIGEVPFRVAKPCARCVVISTDQHDGSRGAEPLRTLSDYRRIDGKVLFGQNLVHLAEGSLRVGDEIRVSETT